MGVLVLREERTARIEKLVVPARRRPLRRRLVDWLNDVPPLPKTEILYEFSVGKYTFTEVAKAWEFVRIPAAEFVRAAETQKVTPVLLMRNGYGRRWWWYLGRFYREALGLTAGEVHEHVLRTLRAQEDEERRLQSQGADADRSAETGAVVSSSLEEDLHPSRRARTEVRASATVR